MLYPFSIAELRVKVNRRFAAVAAAQGDHLHLADGAILKDETTRQRLASHTLWMLERVELMPKAENGKAGLWIGWAIANLEYLNVISTHDAREMTYRDQANGNT